MPKTYQKDWNYRRARFRDVTRNNATFLLRFGRLDWRCRERQADKHRVTANPRLLTPGVRTEQGGDWRWGAPRSPPTHLTARPPPPCSKPRETASSRCLVAEFAQSKLFFANGVRPERGLRHSIRSGKPNESKQGRRLAARVVRSTVGSCRLSAAWALVRRKIRNK